MKNLNSKHFLVAIVGPTAIGKTSVSISLAKQFNAEILSFDSRQFYKELLIGTAPPNADELKAVKHHFVHHISIHDYYNVSLYEQQALAKLDYLFTTNNIHFAVGGSGLYIDTLVNGIADLPDADDLIRNRVKDIYASEGIEGLRQKLKILDFETYQIIDLKNPNRLMRAIEVCLQTGEKYSTLKSAIKKERGFKTIWIGLDMNRNELYERINTRTELMIANGWIEEAKSLLPFRNLNALNTVGYKELFQYFDGNYTFTEAIEKIKTNTRRYAKRQLTWFRRNPEIKWFHPNETKGIIHYIEKELM